MGHIDFSHNQISNVEEQAEQDDDDDTSSVHSENIETELAFIINTDSDDSDSEIGEWKPHIPEYSDTNTQAPLHLAKLIASELSDDQREHCSPSVLQPLLHRMESLVRPH